jgi:hypothetical protein
MPVIVLRELTEEDGSPKVGDECSFMGSDWNVVPEGAQMIQKKIGDLLALGYKFRRKGVSQKGRQFVEDTDQPPESTVVPDSDPQIVELLTEIRDLLKGNKPAPIQFPVGKPKPKNKGGRPPKAKPQPPAPPAPAT